MKLDAICKLTARCQDSQSTAPLRAGVGQRGLDYIFASSRRGRFALGQRCEVVKG